MAERTLARKQYAAAGTPGSSTATQARLVAALVTVTGTEVEPP